MVQHQQNLVHLWHRGNQVLLVVLGIPVCLDLQEDLSVLMVLGIPSRPCCLLILELQDLLDLLGCQGLL